MIGVRSPLKKELNCLNFFYFFVQVKTTCYPFILTCRYSVHVDEDEDIVHIESDQCFVIVVEAVFLPCVHTKHGKSVLQLVVILDIIVNINITCNLFIISKN